MDKWKDGWKNKEIDAIKTEIVDCEEIPSSNFIPDEQGNIVEFFYEETRLIDTRSDSVNRMKLVPYRRRDVKKSNKNVCSKCGMAFSYMKELHKHSRLAHPELTKFVCGECDRVYKHKDSLKRHLNVFHRRLKPYSCDQCERSYRDKRSLNIHLERFHKQLIEANALIADELGNIVEFYAGDTVIMKSEPKDDLINNSLMTNERRKEEPPFIEASPDEAPRSMNIGNSDKYVCLECKMSFLHNDMLDSHVRSVHAELWKFVCAECDPAFKQKSCLSNHIDGVHGELKNFSCEKCNRTYSHKRSLTKHLRSNNKPYIETEDERNTVDSSNNFNDSEGFEYGQVADERVIELNIIELEDGMTQIIQTQVPFQSSGLLTQFETISTGQSNSLAEPFLSRAHDPGFRATGTSIYPAWSVGMSEGRYLQLDPDASRPGRVVGIAQHGATLPAVPVKEGETGFTKLKSNDPSRLSEIKKVASRGKRIKSYICSECNRTFTRKDGLISHINTCQATLKTFKCSDCDHAFKWYDCLRKHIKDSHGNVNRPQCGDSLPRPQCGDSLPRKRSLKKYSNRISEPKRIIYDCKNTKHRKNVKMRFVCGECNRAFRRHRSLKNHLDSGHTKRKRVIR